MSTATASPPAGAAFSPLGGGWSTGCSPGAGGTYIDFARPAAKLARPSGWLALPDHDDLLSVATTMAATHSLQCFLQELQNAEHLDSPGRSGGLDYSPLDTNPAPNNHPHHHHYHHRQVPGWGCAAAATHAHEPPRDIAPAGASPPKRAASRSKRKSAANDRTPLPPPAPARAASAPARQRRRSAPSARTRGCAGRRPRAGAAATASTAKKTKKTKLKAATAAATALSDADECADPLATASQLVGSYVVGRAGAKLAARPSAATVAAAFRAALDEAEEAAREAAASSDEEEEEGEGEDNDDKEREQGGARKHHSCGTGKSDSGDDDDDDSADSPDSSVVMTVGMVKLAAGVYLLRNVHGNTRERLVSGGRGTVQQAVGMNAVAKFLRLTGGRRTLRRHLYWALGFTSTGSSSDETWDYCAESYTKARLKVLYFGGSEGEQDAADGGGGQAE